MGTGIGTLLKLVSFSSKKKTKTRREWRDVFSSDGNFFYLFSKRSHYSIKCFKTEDECDSSSTTSVLASNLHYSDDDDFLTKEERTQGQLITDLGGRLYKLNFLTIKSSIKISFFNSDLSITSRWLKNPPKDIFAADPLTIW